MTKREEFLIDDTEYDLQQLIPVIDYRLTHEARCNAPLGRIEMMMVLIAKSNSYHPLGEAIKNVRWDGINRWELLYQTITLRDDYLHKDLAQVYLRKWVLQCIQAWIGNVEGEPKQIPHILVLAGKGGRGKTKWIGERAPRGMVGIGKDLHLGGMSRVQAGDSVAEVIRWAVTELGELDSTFKQSDINALKNFASRTEDEGRAAYSHTSFRHRRTTALAGSVNDMQFLKAPDRRFWIIGVEWCANRDDDIERCLTDYEMTQLFAQAYVEWISGETYWLEDDEISRHMEQSEAHHDKSAIAERLEELLKNGIEEGATLTPMTMFKICEKLDVNKFDVRLRKELKEVLNECCDYRLTYRDDAAVRWSRVWLVRLGSAWRQHQWQAALGEKN